MKRSAKMGLVTAATFGLLLSGTGIASAAPIDCPGGQTATKVATGWDCVNNGGNDTGAGRHKGTGDKI